MLTRVNRQRGDTIVEVMVVLAVLGLAISISYATSSSSLLAARQAQESSQATEYVQSEVEDLYVLAPTSIPTNTTNNIFQPSTPYCITGAAGALTIQTTISSCTIGSLPYQRLIYNCDKEPLSSIPTGITDPCLNAGIPPNSDTFVVQATWPDVLGQGNDTSTLVYRDHYATTTPPITSISVSWWNNGAYPGVDECSVPSNCTPSTGLSISPNYPNSMILRPNVSLTFDYTKQPVPLGQLERVPAPGDTGLYLKFCYKPLPGYTYPISVSIGGVTESSAFGLDDNGVNDTSGLCPLGADANFKTLSNVNIPQGNSNLIITLTGTQSLTLYDLTIYP